MGLGITVGIAADLKKHDPEALEWIESDFKGVNTALVEAGLPPHQEPTDCDVWSASHPYSFTHHLREVAYHLALGQSVPRDRVLDGQDDALANTYFNAADPILMPRKPSLVSRLLGRKAARPAPVPFLHLCSHGDAEGYYVPVAFDVPVVPKDSKTFQDHANLWPVGSVQSLNAELHVLRDALEIPKGMTAEDEALFNAMEVPTGGTDKPLWQCQPVAAYVCLTHLDGCAHSLKTGAAISYG